MQEMDLVRSALVGNKEAFRTLFEANKDRIFSLTYRYLRNAEDAEDALQETFIKAYNSLDKFKIQKATSFSAWLYRISINCCYDSLRKAKRQKDKSFAALNLENISSTDCSTDPESTQMLDEIRKTLASLLNKLSPKQRMVFILRHYQQLTIREIAEDLNYSEGTVKKMLFRAFETIRKHMKKFLLEKDYEMPQI